MTGGLTIAGGDTIIAGDRRRFRQPRGWRDHTAFAVGSAMTVSYTVVSTNGSDQIMLKIVQDGNDYPAMGMDNEALSIQHVEKIEAKLSDKVIKTVKLKDNSFWEKVKRSFL